MKRVVLAATAIAVLSVAGSAAAATTGPAAAPRPATDLVLSYTAEAGYAAAVSLTCDPAGGGHPKAVRACATLKKAAGDPTRLRPAKTLCTMEYAPVTAEITGTVKGEPVRWSQTFGNRCELARRTGVLFAF